MNVSELKSALRDVADNCLARKVRQTNRVLSALYDDALRPHNIKASQFNILVAVGACGSASPAELQQHLDLEKSTVSRNVERMLANGWLECMPKQERGLTYRLSRKGRQLMQRALPDWKAAQRLARRRLGSKGVQALEQLARSLNPGH